MKTILARNPNVQQLSAKRVVSFLNKAIQNQTANAVVPSLLQTNPLVVNPTELLVQNFINLCKKIINESEYLISNVSYHSTKESEVEAKTNALPREEMVYETSPMKTLADDPFLPIESIYESPKTRKPKRIMRDEDIGSIIAVQLGRKRELLGKWVDTKRQAQADGDEKELARANKNIRSNENAIFSLQTQLDNIRERIPVAGMEMEMEMEMEGRGLYGGSDIASRVIQTANNVIYLLREADLYILTKLFPVARILNPIQKDLLRRTYHEMEDQLINVPVLRNNRVEEDYKTIANKFLEDFNSIL
jgi:hypothetical protein